MKTMLWQLFRIQTAEDPPESVIRYGIPLGTSSISSLEPTLPSLPTLRYRYFCNKKAFCSVVNSKIDSFL